MQSTIEEQIKSAEFSIEVLKRCAERHNDGEYLTHIPLFEVKIKALKKAKEQSL